MKYLHGVYQDQDLGSQGNTDDIRRRQVLRWYQYTHLLTLYGNGPAASAGQGINWLRLQKRER